MKIKILLIFVAVLLFAMFFFACTIENNPYVPQHECEFVTWSVTRPATCMEEGEEESKCEAVPNCPEIGKRLITRLNHIWTSTWSVTRQPSCEKEGEQRRNCTRANCSRDTTRAIPQLTGIPCYPITPGTTIMPSGWNMSQITTLYNNYRNTYLRSTPSGNYYILAKGTGSGHTDGNICVTQSEAHGYGMMIFALMGDKTVFDGMNQLRKANPSSDWQANHLMSWVVFPRWVDETNSANIPSGCWAGREECKTTPRSCGNSFCDGTGVGSGRKSNATDGDLDMAYALLLAHKRWGDPHYLTEARALIDEIKKLNMGANSRRTNLGDWTRWGDPDAMNTRPSDWMPGHFRAFARATNDRFWLEAIDTVYALLEQVSNPNTGLMPDFVTGRPAVADPTCGGAYAENNCHHYANNACRVPWRLATDFAHYGDTRAKTQIDRISAWLRGTANGGAGGDPNRMSHGYHLNGTPMRDWPSMHFVSPFAAGMIANPANQQFLNETYNWMLNNSANDAYQAAIRLLCALLITGNWQAP